MSWLKAIGRFFGRCFRTGNHLRKDRRVPRWARACLSVAPICLIIPGPFDEIMVASVLGIVWLRHRQVVREAWVGAR